MLYFGFLSYNGQMQALLVFNFKHREVGFIIVNH